MKYFAGLICSNINLLRNYTTVDKELCYRNNKEFASTGVHQQGRLPGTANVKPGQATTATVPKSGSKAQTSKKNSTEGY